MPKWNRNYALRLWFWLRLRCYSNIQIHIGGVQTHLNFLQDNSNMKYRRVGQSDSIRWIENEKKKTKTINGRSKILTKRSEKEKRKTFNDLIICNVKKPTNLHIPLNAVPFTVHFIIFFCAPLSYIRHRIIIILHTLHGFITAKMWMVSSTWVHSEVKLDIFASLRESRFAWLTFAFFFSKCWKLETFNWSWAPMRKYGCSVVHMNKIKSPIQRRKKLFTFGRLAVWPFHHSVASTWQRFDIYSYSKFWSERPLNEYSFLSHCGWRAKEMFACNYYVLSTLD